MPMPIIVCIEGPDAVGKTTQVLMLEAKLRKAGYKVLLQEVPIKGIMKKIIYRMLNNGQAKRWPTTFQLIHFLNRFVWQYIFLPFFKENYDFIILGRWSISSLIYGSLEGVNIKLLKTLESVLLKPYKTFIIYGQKFARAENDSYEKDELLQKRVEHLYRNFEDSTIKIHKINNSGRLPSSINEEIIACLGV